MKRYVCKMRGGGAAPECVPLSDIAWSWLGAFIGMAAVSWLNYFVVEGAGATMLIGSFGATAVLVYGVPHSPLAQPRNVLGGHALSAIIGVGCQTLLPALPWLAAPLAVATAIAAMHATRTLHPPGGATALIAVIGGPAIHKLGMGYAVMPVAVGAAVMVAVGTVVNNIPRNKRYPAYWL